MTNDYDNRFDGKHIYEYGKATQAVFEIRGNKIHRHMYAEQPKYEVRGDYIYEYARATQAIFEIRGTLIHEHMKATQALYEIRA